MQTMSSERPATLAPVARDTRPWALRLPDVNWYQVTIAAVSVFALAMEFMFPPSRITLANGSSVYAGHFVASSAPIAVQIDFTCLALELVAIIAIASIGLKLAENR
jgi:hypothetical protein